MIIIIFWCQSMIITCRQAWQEWNRRRNPSSPNPPIKGTILSMWVEPLNVLPLFHELYLWIVSLYVIWIWSEGSEADDDVFNQEEILSECSHNVNLLFPLLDNVSRGESFAKQKKCRDIRCETFLEKLSIINRSIIIPSHPVLIGRWEGLLQTVSESVHNATGGGFFFHR